MEDVEPIAGYPTKRAMLEALYCREMLSIKEIATRLGLGSATVERWLRELNIPRRPRGGPNTSALLTWTLHRLDPRFVFRTPNMKVAEFIHCSTSFVWKYKRGVMYIWSSALSVQPPDLPNTRV